MTMDEAKPMNLTIHERRLHGIGMRYDIDTGGPSHLFVIADHTGRRIIGLGGAEDHPEGQIILDRDQAVMIAALLLGARFTVDTSDDDSVSGDEVVVDTVELTESSPAIGKTFDEVHLPDSDAALLAVISDATPQLIEDERHYRGAAGDRVVVAARAGRIDQVTRYLAGARATDAPGGQPLQAE
jgi:TrkA domain protein